MGAGMATWAYVFTSSRQPKKVLRAVRKIEGVIHADALFGIPDVVAIVTGADIGAMDAVIDQIADVPDVICDRLQGCPVVGRGRSSTTGLKARLSPASPTARLTAFGQRRRQLADGFPNGVLWKSAIAHDQSRLCGERPGTVGAEAVDADGSTGRRR